MSVSNRRQIFPVFDAAVDDDEFHVGKFLRDLDGAIGELAAPADDDVVSFCRILPIEIGLIGDRDVLGGLGIGA